MIGSLRGHLNETGCVVVKVGSSSLTHEDGGLDLNRTGLVARPVTHRHTPDKEILIASSGTVAVGLDPLGFSSHPRNLASMQVAAAMGQELLVTRWQAAFQVHHLDVAQLLLTTEDAMLRQYYTNARASLDRLLGPSVVPIINENDAVTTHEVCFRDNDRLASRMAQMVATDALVLLTDIDGLYTAPPSHPDSELIREVTPTDQLYSVLVIGTTSRISSGGMVTKVQAATMAAPSGIGMILTGADYPGEVLSGEDAGAWLKPSSVRPASRHSWIAHATPARGEVIIDEGASRAITRGEKLLPAARMTCVIGHFDSGEVVDIAGPTGLLGRDIVSYDSDMTARMAGQSAAGLCLAGWAHPKPVVHRDDLAPLL